MLVRNRLGSAYDAAGRHAEARGQFQAALALPGAEDHPQYATALQGLHS